MQNKTPPTSNQDAFNRIWQFFIVEGHNQSRNRHGCAYRGKEKDTACAVGCMLPAKLARKADSLYNTLSNSVINTVCDNIPEVADWFGKVDYEFLSNAQEAHDAGNFNSDKEILLTRLADKFSLSIPAANLGDLTKGRNRVLANAS